MRKFGFWGANGLFCALLAVLQVSPACRAADTPSHPVNNLAATMLQRAQDEIARIEPLVASGVLPKSTLDEAKAKLADAQDEEILSETLYGEVHVQNMTDSQAQQMLAAAQRRVDRQQEIVDERQKLLDNGIMARSEMASFQEELDSRKRVLQLAKNRIDLLTELRQMAETEQKLEVAARANAAAVPNSVMIRYEGNGLFSLSDLPTISTEFEKHFHTALPISALGQTLTHQEMGLDHRNRVDVALNPDSTEGIWLRKLLEQLRIPYLAFRAAVTGAATGAHIHIGLGSARLKLASG